MATGDTGDATGDTGDATHGTGGTTGGATGAPAPGRPRRGPQRWVALGAGVVVAAVLAAVLFAGRGGPGPGSGGSSVAPGIDTAEAQLLSLDVLPASAATAAPPIDLVDQHGQPVTLAQFRGKAVVWSLNDDRCTDMCTLFAEDVRAADRDLGPLARDVVFLSVNANPYYPSPADVQAWSATNDLASVPNWVYATGSPAQLQQTWDAYHVAVQLDPATRTVVHDFTDEFIDPQGRLRAVGEFGSGAVSVAYYGHALAQLAVDLLPPGEQRAVGGPTLAGTGAAATIGAKAPAFTLPRLGAPGTARLAGYRGKPLVLNFWSSTCTACRREMPAMQQVHAQFGSQVDVVGVDVADPSSQAAEAFARARGVTYPLLADHGGSVAAAYGVSSLPETVVIGPDGTVEARHQGALTDPQLSAVLQLDFQNLMPSSG